MNFPNIDPVAFSFFGFAVHWYGLAYVTAFLLGSKYIEWSFQKFGKNVNLSKEDADRIFTWIILGVLLGGRLGYALFYNTDFYLNNPLHILKVWEGGMSFHGGLLGVITAVAIYCKKYSVNIIHLFDLMAPAFCIGLFLGRIANFINGELYGNVTNKPWGIVFPTDPTGLPRHPSQLYEAALEGVLLFIILHIALVKLNKKGVVSGLFLIGYGTFRSLVEFVRMRDIQLSDGIFQTISMGQILSIPMIIIGLYLILQNKRSS